MHEAKDLLAAARDVLLTEILPELPAGDLRYRALMVGNAIAIALRMLEATAERPAYDAHALKARIRAGDLDPGAAEHARVAAYLRAAARNRCSISNPKAL